MTMSSRMIANPFAGPRDTLAGCLGGSGDTACFTASSQVTASAPAAASPFADCLRAEGRASCFVAARLNALAAELTAPVAPSGLTANVSGTTVTLIWTAPATGDPAASYLIEAGSAPGLSNLASVSTGNAGTLFSAGGVPVGTYYVRVRAANAAGSSSPSNEVVLQVGGPVGCGPLGTPTLSVVTNSGGTVGFSWTIPSGESNCLHSSGGFGARPVQPRQSRSPSGIADLQHVGRSTWNLLRPGTGEAKRLRTQCSVQRGDRHGGTTLAGWCRHSIRELWRSLLYRSHRLRGRRTKVEF